MKVLERHLYEPISALTHLLSAVAAFVGLLLLVRASWPVLDKVIPLAVYGGSLVVLFASSTLLHALHVNERRRMWLNRIDHAAIFWLIAGSYTPIVTTFYKPSARGPTLMLIWFVALVGGGLKLWRQQIHGGWNVGIYMALGWGGALPAILASNLLQVLAWRDLLPILLGGAFYSIGFVTYWKEWPDPVPGVFGHHEIWHLQVMAGSVCHFLFMWRTVLPFPVT